MAEEMSGSEFRQKFEETLEQNKELTGQLAEAKAKEYSFVKAEDFSGLSVDQFEEHAVKLQEQRTDERLGVIKDVLRSQGVSDDTIDDQAQLVLDGGKIETAASTVDEGWERAMGVSSGGAPVPTQNLSELHGNDAIAAGLAKGERERARRR